MFLFCAQSCDPPTARHRRRQIAKTAPGVRPLVEQKKKKKRSVLTAKFLSIVVGMPPVGRVNFGTRFAGATHDRGRVVKRGLRRLDLGRPSFGTMRTASGRQTCASRSVDGITLTVWSEHHAPHVRNES